MNQDLALSTVAPAPSTHELITRILDHHRRLRSDVPVLTSLANKVIRLQGAREPERLRAVVLVLNAFGEDMKHHLDYEENELFPRILRGDPELDLGVEGAMHDHTVYLWFLDNLRQLTSNYQMPEAGGRTWRALWAGLSRLDHNLTEHLALENELFFPRR